jgi:hypothetical protein
VAVLVPIVTVTAVAVVVGAIRVHAGGIEAGRGGILVGVTPIVSMVPIVRVVPVVVAGGLLVRVTVAAVRVAGFTVASAGRKRNREREGKAGGEK